jgi:hypothetical protein
LLPSSISGGFQSINDFVYFSSISLRKGGLKMGGHDRTLLTNWNYSRRNTSPFSSDPCSKGFLLTFPLPHIFATAYRDENQVSREKREKKERFRITAGSSLDYTDRKIRGGEN